MKKILLTGATGYVGRRVLRNLLDQGHMILAPVRDAAKLSEFSGDKKLLVLQGDFYDDRILDECAYFGPDVIMHLAAKGPKSKGSMKEFTEVNVNGTEALATFALEAEVERFVYCSCTGVYGTIPCRLPADPWTAAMPDDNHNLSKHRAEKIVYSVLKDYVPFIILRPSIIYGPGLDGFLPRLTKMVKGKYFPLVKKNIEIHLTHVQTLVEVLEKTVECEVDNECIVNVADEDSVPLRDVVQMIYSHYHGGEYPRWLRWSAGSFSFIEGLTKLIHLENSRKRLQRISNSWIYDVITLKQSFPVKLNDTMTSIKAYLISEHETTLEK